jgi:hypothetical protein
VQKHLPLLSPYQRKIRLDSIGIAGFSHDFGTLRGKHSSVAALFDSFAKTEPNFLDAILFMLSTVIPVLQKIPTARNMILKKLHVKMSEIADELLERMRKEKEGQIGEENAEEKSIIGLLSAYHLTTLFNPDLKNLNSQGGKCRCRAAYVAGGSFGPGIICLILSLTHELMFFPDGMPFSLFFLQDMFKVCPPSALTARMCCYSQVSFLLNLSVQMFLSRPGHRI